MSQFIIVKTWHIASAVKEAFYDRFGASAARWRCHLAILQAEHNLTTTKEWNIDHLFIEVNLTFSKMLNVHVPTLKCFSTFCITLVSAKSCHQSRWVKRSLLHFHFFFFAHRRWELFQLFRIGGVYGRFVFICLCCHIQKILYTRWLFSTHLCTSNKTWKIYSSWYYPYLNLQQD